MFPLARQWPCLVPLLAVLWAVGRTGADQPPPAPDAGTSHDPDLLLKLIVNEVTSVVQPLVGELATRIGRLDSRLIAFGSRLNGIETRLTALDFNQDSVNSGLAELASRVDSAENGLGSRLDELASRIDSSENGLGFRLDELASRVDSIESRLDSRLEELVSQTNSTEQRLDSRLDELVSEEDRLAERHISRLYNVSSRLDAHSFRLDEQSSRLDVQSSRLDGQSSRLDEQSSRLDTLANLTAQGGHRDCSQLPAGAQSGVYLLLLDRSLPVVPAYCDLDTDGGMWTVIQRRADIQPRQDFYLPWSDYKDGFGDLNKEFWWGLENIWMMTSPTDRQYQLRIELADFDGERRHAVYGRFRVAPEAEGYRLSVADYSGDAGDSLIRVHNDKKFSTRDRDQDRSPDHCAQEYKGAWWFSFCYDSHLNGQYLPGEREKREGIHWYHWRGRKYSLKETVMKIRPVTTD